MAFLYRGRFKDYLNTFETREKPDYLVLLLSVSQRGSSTSHVRYANSILELLYQNKRSGRLRPILPNRYYNSKIAFSMFSERSISAVPIIDEEGVVVNLYETVDMRLSIPSSQLYPKHPINAHQTSQVS
jgi:hypothetical protein